MARSYSELGKKSTELIEEGKGLERELGQAQSQFMSSTAQVEIARSALSRAQQTDSEGNPRGDVESARARLAVAENRQAATQRALDRAKRAVEQNNREKRSHIEEIERHNRISRDNINRLSMLSGLAFAENIDSTQRGLVERYNEIEQSRVALLESMGENASAETIQTPSISGSSGVWNGAGYGSLDFSVPTTSGGGGLGYGGGTSGSSLNSGNYTQQNGVSGTAGTGGVVSDGMNMHQSDNLQVGADGQNSVSQSLTSQDMIGQSPGDQVFDGQSQGNPVGNSSNNTNNTGLSSTDIDSYGVNSAVKIGGFSDNIASRLNDNDLVEFNNKITEIENNPALSNREKSRQLTDLKIQMFNRADERSVERQKVLSLNSDFSQVTERYKRGLEYINRSQDDWRNNFRQLGVEDSVALETELARMRLEQLQALSDDIYQGKNSMCSYTPDYQEVVNRIFENPDYIKNASRESAIFALQNVCYNNNLSNNVDFSDFDKLMALDLTNAVKDAKKDFPQLKIGYLGSFNHQIDGLATVYKEKRIKQLQDCFSDDNMKDIIESIADADAKKYAQNLHAESQGAFAWSLYSANKNSTNPFYGVAISNQYCADYNGFKKAKEKNVAEMFKPIGCDSPRATADHEIGHEIDHILNASSDKTINMLYAKMVASGRAREELSEYSKKNIQEFIAEAYSEYRNNPEPRYYSRQVYKRLLELERNLIANGN